MSMKQKIEQYVRTWETRGYRDGIPDEVPLELMHLRLAPSYKAIAIAILKNDASCKSLGFTAKVSLYYSALKRIEIEARNGGDARKSTRASTDRTS